VPGAYGYEAEGREALLLIGRFTPFAIGWFAFDVLYSGRVHDVYRSAASVLLLKPTNEAGVFQILLLHKPRKKDAWQLPQGGCEAGENIQEAALRELKEEAGISDVTYLGASEKVYKYDFPASFRRFRPDHVCGQKIEFVYALAPADTQVQVDANEVDKYMWVYPGQVRQYVKRKEYLGLVQELIKEATEKAIQ
jgi:putative (di)nucleoside polyphosphate hydrolase